MKSILITGINGYVGKEVGKQLLQHGKEVTGLDIIKPKEKIQFIKTDLTNYKKLLNSLKDKTFDTIMHIASLPIDTGNPLEMIKVNVNGCQHILEYARKTKVERFVLASSISAYEWYPGTKFSPPDYLPVDENHPCRPKDMYSTTKLMQELLTMTYYHQYKVPATILRLSAVVGPEGRGGGRSWLEFARNIYKGKKVQIPHYSPEEMCHYVDIRDVARMFIVVAEEPKAIGEIFNCVGPRAITGEEFGNILKKLFKNIKLVYGYPWSMAQGGKICFSMSKAENLIGFKPKYYMEDTMKYMKDWIYSGGLGNI